MALWYSKKKKKLKSENNQFFSTRARIHLIRFKRVNFLKILVWKFQIFNKLNSKQKCDFESPNLQVYLNILGFRLFFFSNWIIKRPFQKYINNSLSLKKYIATEESLFFHQKSPSFLLVKLSWLIFLCRCIDFTSQFLKLIS